MIAEYERAQIAERSRRGKRHRAKLGSVNVLSGAPYGYQYVKKTEGSEAHYVVNESQAEIVREVFRLYTQELWSLGAITRELNRRQIPTHSGKGRWERSTVWGMLRNPAYQGQACFGKTEARPRQHVNKRLRDKGGFSPRCSAGHERPHEQWIAIAVPALVSEATFGLAKERLSENRRLSARRTKVPTLLQGLLVCGQCGYGLYRTSTKTTRRQAQYYRCLGSDRYRHLRAPVCSCRPIRQEYLDDLVWAEIVRLLNEPALVQAEITRRVEENLSSDPAEQRKHRLGQELKRVEAQLDKLLDAYQEELLSLAQLRDRVPALRRRQAALESELQSATLQAMEHTRLIELQSSLENFLGALRQSAQDLDVRERQKIIRLSVKQIVVNADTLTIQHCLPVSAASQAESASSYALCTRSHHRALRRSLLRRLPFLGCLHDSLLEQLPDHLQHAAVCDLFFH
jgi:site-specific DNA recombinase